jgi:hypothetical protein
MGPPLPVFEMSGRRRKLDRMRLAPDGLALVQSFLRHHLGEPGLTLPDVVLHAPRPASLLHRADVLALTVGRHVVLSPVVVSRDSCGHPRLPSRLVVHELVHVVQYRRGLARFLLRYLRSYAAGLRRHGLARPARHRAYRDIPLEAEARAAERAWAALDGVPTWLAVQDGQALQQPQNRPSRLPQPPLRT